MKKLSALLFLLTLLSFQISDQRSIYLIPQLSTGVTAADYDMDGDMDIIVNHLKDYQTNWQGTYILENDGYGEFIFYDSIYDTVGFFNRVGHLTGQNYLDIVSYARDSIQVLSTDGENFWYNKYYIGGPYVNDFELGDINNDDFTDIIFSMSNPQCWGILYNFNNEGFDEPVYYELDYSPIDIDCSRINDDTIDDIIIGTAQSEVEILLNHVDSFNLVKLDTYGMEICTSDFNLDGYTDIITMSELLSFNIVRIYKNNGDETFSKVNEFYTPFLIGGYHATYVDQDDLIDLIFQSTAYGSYKGFLIHYNQGNFQFSDTSLVPAERMGETRRSSDCSDLDGNGFNDLILSRRVYDPTIENSPLEIFFNDGNGNFVDNPQTSFAEPFTTNELLLNSYPNPFSFECTIEHNTKTKNGVTISIYTLSGQKVKSLSNKHINSTNKIIWNGTDENGKEVNPGIYIISLTAGKQTSNCRVIKNN